MPISFWKDRDERIDLTADLKDCRERYVADGNRVAERLARRDEVLAVWLSGPFTYPRIAPESDLHMAVLTAGGGGHVYHHQIPPFSEVGRRLEIAFFPVDYYERMIERGCAAWGDVFDGHKLSDVEILYERDGVLSGILERLDSLRPARMFVGAQIEALKAEHAAVLRLVSGNRGDECVLRARALATSALKLFIVAGRGRLFSKPSHPYPVLASLVEGAPVTDYEYVHDIAGLREKDAGRIVGMCSDFVRELYERQGVCAADSD